MAIDTIARRAHVLSIVYPDGELSVFDRAAICEIYYPGAEEEEEAETVVVLDKIPTNRLQSPEWQPFRTGCSPWKRNPNARPRCR